MWILAREHNICGYKDSLGTQYLLCSSCLCGFVKQISNYGILLLVCQNFPKLKLIKRDTKFIIHQTDIMRIYIVYWTLPCTKCDIDPQQGGWPTTANSRQRRPSVMLVLNKQHIPLKVIINHDKTHTAHITHILLIYAPQHNMRRSVTETCTYRSFTTCT